jgi:hypothetical protein
MMKPMKSLVIAGLILGVLAGICEAQTGPYNPSYQKGLEDGQQGYQGLAPYKPSESFDRQVQSERDYQQGVGHGLNQYRQEQALEQLRREDEQQYRDEIRKR